MLSFLSWYLTLTLMGWLTFPLAYRMLPALPDRGYAFSRILGLLLWGYGFWLLGSLGVLYNDRGGILLALALVLMLSAWAVGKDLPGFWRDELSSWLRNSGDYVIAVEALFLAAFACLAFVRAANPDVLGTEKPMELAFINAILHSPSFPPHDPWLSGYAISYYYFGYVLVALLAQLTATSGSVAFNLGLSSVFALSAVGAYGLVYNLLAVWDWGNKSMPARPVHTKPANLIYPLLGVLFVLLIGNLEGVLEVLHARGLFWSVALPDSAAAGELVSPFWKWMDIKDLDEPPTQPFTTVPTRYLWWWRASRVVQDYNFIGDPLEIIDEIPSFSYVLGDLHPHVLAMPFALLTMALALNLSLGGSRGKISLGKPSSTQLNLHLNLPSFVLAAVVLGGMAFLNTWDFPIYVALFAGAYTLWRAQEPGLDGSSRSGWNWERLKDFITLGLALGIGGGLCYLPFYVGFSSQAGGILPNLIYPTRGAHLWVMFGLVFLPIGAFLVYLGRSLRVQPAPGSSKYTPVRLAIGVVFALWLFSLLLSFMITTLPILGDLYMGSLAASDRGSLFLEAVRRRFINLGGWVTLAALLAASLTFLAKAGEQGGITGEDKKEKGSSGFPVSHAFALLLILMGTLLVLGPEFFYIRDQFGWRINTIFKFYYQAWLIWGIAAAYGTVVLMETFSRRWDLLSRLGVALLLGAGLVYPVLGFWTKTEGFHPSQGWTLDGVAYLERQSPDEMAAIRWLQDAPPGVVVEAVGGSYSAFARVATFSGQPNVLGWPGHESQWRGGAKEMGSREADIERLYRSNRWEEVQALMEQYHIRYVFVGSLEHSQYKVNDEKFNRFLQVVFEQGSVKVFEVPGVVASP